MSALEASRAATARAAEAARLAAAAATQAQAELKAARAEENRIAWEQASTELAEKVAKEREDYQMTFGPDSNWIGVDADQDSIGIHIQAFAEFKCSVNLTIAEATGLRDYIDSKIK